MVASGLSAGRKLRGWRMGAWQRRSHWPEGVRL
jgi:hypothetical protein